MTTRTTKASARKQQDEMTTHTTEASARKQQDCSRLPTLSKQITINQRVVLLSDHTTTMQPLFPKRFEKLKARKTQPLLPMGAEEVIFSLIHLAINPRPAWFDFCNDLDMKRLKIALRIPHIREEVGNFLWWHGRPLRKKVIHSVERPPSITVPGETLHKIRCMWDRKSRQGDSPTTQKHPATYSDKLKSFLLNFFQSGLTYQEWKEQQREDAFLTQLYVLLETTPSRLTRYTTRKITAG